jgi:hypothetical protein
MRSPYALKNYLSNQLLVLTIYLSDDTVSEVIGNVLMKQKGPAWLHTRDRLPDLLRRSDMSHSTAVLRAVHDADARQNLSPELEVELLQLQSEMDEAFGYNDPPTDAEIDAMYATHVSQDEAEAAILSDAQEREILSRPLPVLRQLTCKVRRIDLSAFAPDPNRKPAA